MEASRTHDPTTKRLASRFYGVTYAGPQEHAAVEVLGREVIVADPNFAPMYATRTRTVKTDRRDARAVVEVCLLGARTAPPIASPIPSGMCAAACWSGTPSPARPPPP